jgi:ribonuclease PH
MIRSDGRSPDQARPVSFDLGFLPHAEGSTLVSLGDTRVICAVSVEESVPPFVRGQGVGWLTAEYRMLPRATHTRTPRDTAGRVDGRATEIQRLIGRALRASVDRTRLGERTLIVDCDVLNADGGTRTAAITGAFVAVTLACYKLLEAERIALTPVRRQLAAISAGIVQGEACLDLVYAEDSIADVDCNAVMTAQGETVEFQLSAERDLATDEGVDALRRLTRRGIDQMLAAQRAVLNQVSPTLLRRVLAAS